MTMFYAGVVAGVEGVTPATSFKPFSNLKFGLDDDEIAEINTDAATPDAKAFEDSAPAEDDDYDVDDDDAVDVEVIETALHRADLNALRINQAATAIEAISKYGVSASLIHMLDPTNVMSKNYATFISTESLAAGPLKNSDPRVQSMLADLKAAQADQMKKYAQATEGVIGTVLSSIGKFAVRNFGKFVNFFKDVAAAGKTFVVSGTINAPPIKPGFIKVVVDLIKGLGTSIKSIASSSATKIGDVAKNIAKTFKSKFFTIKTTNDGEGIIIDMVKSGDEFIPKTNGFIPSALGWTKEGIIAAAKLLGNAVAGLGGIITASIKAIGKWGIIAPAKIIWRLVSGVGRLIWKGLGAIMTVFKKTGVTAPGTAFATA